MRKAIVSKPRSTAKSATSSGKQGTIKDGTRSYPKSAPKPDKPVTSTMMEPWLPPNYAIYDDDSEKRWLCTTPGRPAISRSWNKYSYNGAARACLIEAWSQHEKAGGDIMPFTLPEW
eukprot:32178-Amphidinium_carterae.1